MYFLCRSIVTSTDIFGILDFSTINANTTAFNKFASLSFAVENSSFHEEADDVRTFV